MHTLAYIYIYIYIYIVMVPVLIKDQNDLCENV